MSGPDQLRIAEKMGLGIFQAMQVASDVRQQPELRDLLGRHSDRLAHDPACEGLLEAFGDKAKTDPKFIATLGEDLRHNPAAAQTLDQLLTHGDQHQLDTAALMLRNYRGDTLKIFGDKFEQSDFVANDALVTSEPLVDMSALSRVQTAAPVAAPAPAAPQAVRPRFTPPAP